MRIAGKWIFFFTFLIFGISNTQANDSYCAQVKIEILQELTLERQGFEATMVITNGLDTFPLEDIEVEIQFSDENDNTVIASSNGNDSNTDVDFYIRLDQQKNVGSLASLDRGKVAGGSIAPNAQGEIRWLIIPVPGAAKNSPTGKLYFVGAKLKYTFGGEEETVDVAPDTIIVKPQPKLTLDYFLTEHVFGDDAFTEVIEPVVPYTLGIRLANNGYGEASNVKLDTAQPRIVENDQGLAIGFSIVGSYVNDAPAAESLLLNFGDIDAGGRTMGRWLMESTLSGKFIEFDAAVTHAAEYGGELTSQIDAANAHFLLRDVQVDVTGRDQVNDFLAHDGDAARLWVYESENLNIQNTAGSVSCDDCSPVLQMSSSLSSVTETPAGSLHTLTPGAPDNGFVLLKQADPYNGEKSLSHVIRNDGKRILPENAWLAKERAEDKESFDHFIYIFDHQVDGSYQLIFNNSVQAPQPPVIQFVSDKVTYEGNQIGFLLRASDPNGDEVGVTIAAMPSGADFQYEFISSGNEKLGRGVFNWTPQLGQAGTYPVTFVANDGSLTTSFTVTIKVNPANDIDGDGLPDDWEREHFGDLSRDGTDDYDNDGYSDLEEYEKGWNPKEAAKVPNVPMIISPAYKGEVDTTTPVLVIENSRHSRDIEVTYQYELYADDSMAELLVVLSDVEEGATVSGSSDLDHTEVLISAINQGDQTGNNLLDNSHYYWRVRGVSDFGNSEWAEGQFFINTANDAPNAPVLRSPQPDDSLIPVVSESQPTLSGYLATDIDGDALSYAFKVYNGDDDVASSVPLYQINDLQPGNDSQSIDWQVPERLIEDTRYQWQLTVTDEHGATAVSEIGVFIISTVNDAPTTPTLLEPDNAGEVNEALVTFYWRNSLDPEGALVHYQLEWDVQPDFNSGSSQLIDNIAGGIERTRHSIQFTGDNEDQDIFWRVRALDGDLQAGGVASEWQQGQFFINQLNLSPPKPNIANPANDATVEVLRPELTLNEVIDQDRDLVSYQIELYDDLGMSQKLASVTVSDAKWVVAEDLDDNKYYYWRARSLDEHGSSSSWTLLNSFFVNNQGINDLPLFNFVLPESNIELTDGDVLIQWTDSDPDSDADITLWYEGSGSAIGEIGTIAENISEDADGDADRFLWHVSALPVGSYQVKATVTDEDNTTTATASGQINIIPSSGAVIPSLRTDAELDESGQKLVEVDVVLDRAPYRGSSVTINIRTSDLSEAEIVEVVQSGEKKPDNYLYFTEDNWNQPYTVVLRGVDDCDIDGDQSVDLVLGVVESDDTGFNGLDPQDVVLNNLDNERADQTLFICDYQKISQKIVDDKIEVSLKGKIKNIGESIFSVKAVLENASADYDVIDGHQLYFENVSVDSLTESIDNLVIQYPHGVEFDTNNLQWRIEIVKTSSDGLPEGWQSKDIGNWAFWMRGSQQVSGNTYRIRAAGHDIWGAWDSFYYVYRNLNGDGEITAKLDMLNRTHDWAKAGVMIRESSWVGSKYAFTMLTPGQGSDFQFRKTTSLFAENIGVVPEYKLGSWIKLKREGNDFFSYISSDAVNWTLLSTQTIAMDVDVMIGLAVTSHRGFNFTEAVFRSVWVED